MVVRAPKLASDGCGVAYKITRIYELEHIAEEQSILVGSHSGEVRWSFAAYAVANRGLLGGEMKIEGAQLAHYGRARDVFGGALFACLRLCGWTR